MDVDRLLARAAVTPPAVVLQTTFANGLGIIRDLAAHGVPVLALDPGPRAVGLRSRFAADLERGVEEIGFPAILKPVESPAFKQRFHRHVLEIADRGQLDEVYATVDDCGTLMYQEIIPGGGGGVAILGHNNRFDRRSAQGSDDVYWRLVEWAQADGGLVASAREIVRRWQDGTGEAA